MPLPRLAIDGGAAAIPEGQPAWPQPDPRVESALRKAYAAGDWGKYHGPHGEHLREILSAMHEQRRVQLCCSGTIAVELALRGLQVGAGDEVLLAGYDFPGNFRAIEAVGARPVLCDIEAARWTVDLEHWEAALSDQVKVAIVSHLHGGVAPMQQLCEIAKRRGVAIVEDVCQSPGATAQGKQAGCWGDVSVLSFGGSKLLTAGRGGAVMSSDAQVMQRMTIFRERGNDAFAMSELQACVLPPQLETLAEQNAQRLSAVERLKRALTSAACLTPVSWDPDCSPAFFKLGLLYHPEHCGGIPRERFVAACRAEGVAIDAGFRGFAGRSARRCRQAGSLEAARQAADQTLVLHHPVLLGTDDQIDRVAEAILKVVNHHRQS